MSSHDKPYTDALNSNLPVKLVKCPNCAGESVYASSNPYRPFCSAYCKNSDFVAWANEDFRVPEKPSSDQNN